MIYGNCFTGADTNKLLINKKMSVSLIYLKAHSRISGVIPSSRGGLFSDGMIEYNQITHQNARRHFHGKENDRQIYIRLA